MAELLPLLARVEIQAAGEGKPKRFSMLAYSGSIMSPPGWPSVVIDLAGADISGDIPILAGHAEDLDSIVGQGRATIQDHQLHVAGIVTDATPAGRKAIALNAAGIGLQASIGFAPDQRDHIAAGTKVSVNGRTFTAPTDGLTIIRAGKLREVSLLPVGADPNTQVRIAAAAASQLSKKESTMPDENPYIMADGEAAQLQANFRSGTPDPAMEQRRMDLIRCWTPTFGPMAPPELQEKAAALKAQAVAGEISLDQLREGAVELIRAERPKAPAIHASRRDEEPAMLTAAFCQSAGLQNMEKHFKPEIIEAADQTYRGGIGLGELLLRCARENGYTGRDAIRSGNIGEILRAAFSTHTLTTLLSTTGNKFLLDGFSSVEQTWKAISRTRPVNDFKEVTSYRLTSDLVFEEVGPAGEIAHGTLGQESFTNQAKTYAKMMALTRQDIVNDDLGAFDDLRNRFGRGAALKLNSVFWAAFLDDASFFTTARGNLQEGANTLLADDGVALAAAEKLFLNLSDDDGHPLGVTPALLLVPTALSVTGRKLYVSQEMRDTTADTTIQTANLFHNRFRPLTSAYIGANNTNGSDTGWYLTADPSNLAVMEVTFLDGQQTPTIESADADFNTLGIETRGYFDFGVAKAEWRAGVKSDGTD